MNKLQINVNDIKSVAKILKKELASMDFELSHSSALNLASRSLGFKNYQAYNGLLEKKDEDSILNMCNEFEEYMIDRASQRIENYPSIHELFVKLDNNSIYDMYIYKERLEYENLYSILFEIKDSYTGRTFFHAKDNTFFIFDKHKNQLPYEYQIAQNNIFYYFEMINQLKEKSWITNDTIDDVMKLIQSIEYDKKELVKIVNKYSNEELEKLYKEQKND
jgi:uncharacterized protein (UPF0335 family)